MNGDIAKCENGYHRYFDEWAERDMINMLHNYRNNPCVIMWSIGNEVLEQWSHADADTFKSGRGEPDSELRPFG